MNTALDYVRNGWALTPIQAGSKGPRTPGWNLREHCVTRVEDCARITAGIGLAHAYSGTAAVDFDDLAKAKVFLSERGIDTDSLLQAETAVRISSGRPNRAKLLYRLETPLRSLKLADGALELRCATASGLSVQDVLPPSVHPVTNLPYVWEYGEELVGDWRCLPELPKSLRQLWETEIGRASVTAQAEPDSIRFTESALRDLVARHDPNADYHAWLKIGMACHHESEGEEWGFAIWDEWSKQSPKYKGTGDLRQHWRSFGRGNERAVTAASLRVEAPPAAAGEFPLVPVAPSRPCIKLRAGKLHEYADECERLLANELYTRERQLVRIGGAPDITDPGDIRRDNSQAVIVGASTQWLRRRLNQRAEFRTYRRREKEWSLVDCPRDLAENIAHIGDWPVLSALDTIARAPFVRADGTICEAPGYDTAARVYYAPNAIFPSVPASPSRGQGEAALNALLEPFQEFPFATTEARSVFAAAILTEVVRSAIGTAPAFFFTAPTAGTGKSLLSEMSSRIVHGNAPAMRPWASEEELRKTLFASLLAGDRSIGFDNLQDGTKVRSSTLCAFLTASVYTDRKLGVSEAPSLPNRSVVLATGNNINPAGDLARRSLVCRLDASMEAKTLRARSFAVSDLRRYVSDNRPTLLIAALTVLAAHRDAGYPRSKVSLPSFEAWSKLVRDPLMWLGMADPVDSQDEETEDDSAPLAEAFRLLNARSVLMQKPAFLATDIAYWADVLGATVDDLGMALEGSGCSSAVDPARVGFWLRHNRDRIAGGLKLERVGSQRENRSASWRLRST